MGEVTVKLRISNMVDEVLARQGKLKPEEVRSKIIEALVDTGAVMSTIPEYLAEELGLTIWGTKKIFYANDSPDEVPITEGVRLELEGRGTVEDMLVLGNRVLIGQTVLEKTDLLVDCSNRRLIGAHGAAPVIAIR